MYSILCLVYLPLCDLENALDFVGIEWGWLSSRLHTLECAIGRRGEIPGKIFG